MRRLKMMFKKLFNMLPFIILGGIVTIAVLTFLPGLYPYFPDNLLRRQLQPEFEHNQTAWFKSDIAHYEVTVFAYVHPVSDCYPARVEIRNGRIVKVLEQPEFQWTTCHYDHLTVEALYETTAQHLYLETPRDEAVLISIKYHPDLHYPTYLNIYSSDWSIMPFPPTSVTLSDLKVLP
jgi:hypothetical protein